MAKEFNVSIRLKDAVANGVVTTFAADTGVHPQVMAHRDIHAVVTEGEGDAAVTKEIFTPWDAIAEVSVSVSDSATPAPEDAVCNGGE